MKALALLLLLLPSLAFAQSDTRKVAVWTYNQTTNSAGCAPCVNATGSVDITGQDAYFNTITALERMGVPYTVFNLADSVGGWQSTIGAARPAGTADSTWFRSNGYMLHIFNVGDISTSSTLLPIRVFQDGRTRGGYVQSPLRGEWGVPALVFSPYADNNAGETFFNGVAAVFSVAAPNNWSNYFANGDSVAGAQDSDTQMRRQPTFADSLSEVYIWAGDSTGAAGATRIRAWRWKSKAYYFPGSTASTQATWTLLGLAQVFRDLGYTPRRKLNLHMTLDHLYTQTGSDGYTTPTDSFLVYANRNNWRPSIAMKSHSSEYALTSSAIRTRMNAWVNSKRLPVFPHSHITGVGNWLQGTSWNLSTFADTATARARWNVMEAYIAGDTLRLPLAKGYERTAGLPADQVGFKQLYILAQNRYPSVRSTASDSIGMRPNQNLIAATQVFSGPATGIRYRNLPWKWIDPVSSRSIWVHGANTFPTADDTLWSNMDGKSGSFTIQAYMMNHIEVIGRAILWDADWYWHPNQNLETSPATTNMPMNVYMRRLTYFMNRISNICEVQPYYKPKNPRRSSIPR